MPKRSKEILNQSQKTTDYFLTPEKIKKMRAELDNLINKERKLAIEDVQTTAAMGDFSENAAYQAAKGHLRRLNGRIDSLQEKLNNAIVIDQSSSGTKKIRIGSTVVVEANHNRATYEIVGSQETNPARGKISYLSALGSALLEHSEGETIAIKINDAEIEYIIVDVK